MVSHRVLIAGLASCAILVACGLKGPLYLPQEDAPEATGVPMPSESETPAEDINEAPK